MPNHLIGEKSPYLLQHAHNPVDWRPWGPEAFEIAAREDKPIFLSIGYSTCHWCHVMERESFENNEVAGLLNTYFIPVKVDREERPDVDRIYMAFVQAVSGGGGWPMSVFLTPKLRPFYGGTYFPPDNRYGRPGFINVLQSLAQAWRNERAKIDQSSEDVIRQLIAQTEPKASHAPAAASLDTAYNYFRRSFDPTHGGFGNAPKFPRPAVIEFLLRYHIGKGSDDALDMSLQTLRAMAEGGMNDQIGGGFHRYSVDELWFLPHFEKMLYDQAQLAISYVEAYQITRDPYYAGVARQTLEYVLRDLSDPDGAFYSAEDADSVIDPAHPHEKGEGAFYVWTRQEIDSLLGHPAASIFALRYGVETSGNVHNDPHGEFPGKNILYIRHTVEETAKQFHLTTAATEASLAQSSQGLLTHRATRIRPHLDDKILTAWNGLMTSAFAKAAQILDEPRYADAARRAADFILTRMYDPGTKTLLRRYRDRDAAIPGFLDDYAFFCQALLDLYETAFRAADLETAMELNARMLELFEDREAGGFFSTAEGDSTLVMRMKDDYDGAEPAGNSVALLNQVRLARITNLKEYDGQVDRTLQGLNSRIAQQPVAVPLMLTGVDLAASPKRQIIIAGDPAHEDTQAMLREVRTHFAPNRVTLLIGQQLARLVPELANMSAIGGQATAYVCENFTCQLPTTDLAKLHELLQ